MLGFPTEEFWGFLHREGKRLVLSADYPLYYPPSQVDGFHRKECCTMKSTT